MGYFLRALTIKRYQLRLIEHHNCIVCSQKMYYVRRWDVEREKKFPIIVRKEFDECWLWVLIFRNWHIQIKTGNLITTFQVWLFLLWCLIQRKTTKNSDNSTHTLSAVFLIPFRDEGKFMFSTSNMHTLRNNYVHITSTKHVCVWIITYFQLLSVQIWVFFYFSQFTFMCI